MPRHDSPGPSESRLIRSHSVTVADPSGLRCHPGSGPGLVRGIGARLGLTGAGLITVSFSLDGDLGRLRIPRAGPTRRGDRLWEHTCFEAFVAPAAGSAYHELNFSPSGEWAEYAFARYRERELSAQDGDLAPEVAVSRAEGRLGLTAVLHLDRLPLLAGSPGLRVALSAVVEEEGGRLSYWALWHGPGRPDFHHPDAFALQLELAGPGGSDPTEG